MRLSAVLLGASLLLLATTSFVAPDSDAALLQQQDEQVPPGNPVIGSDRPGDIQEANQTNYALWGVVAVCLISAGVLLVKIERWEARRNDQAESAG